MLERDLDLGKSTSPRQSPRWKNKGRIAVALSLAVMHSLSSYVTWAADVISADNLAKLFLTTCLQHIDSVSQLSAIANARGGRRIENPTEAEDQGASTEAETWLLTEGGDDIVLHFKHGTRDAWRFGFCLVRQTEDVFDVSFEAITRSLVLRQVRSPNAQFTKHASFLLSGNPVLINISAGQEPLARFTLISASKLLGSGR